MQFHCYVSPWFSHTLASACSFGLPISYTRARKISEEDKRVIKGLEWLLYEENWRTDSSAEKRDCCNGHMKEVNKIRRALRGCVGLGFSFLFLQKDKGH